MRRRQNVAVSRSVSGSKQTWGKMSAGDCGISPSGFSCFLSAAHEALLWVSPPFAHAGGFTGNCVMKPECNKVVLKHYFPVPFQRIVFCPATAWEPSGAAAAAVNA